MKTFKHLVNGLVLVAVLAGNAIAGTPDELRAIVDKIKRSLNNKKGSTVTLNSADKEALKTHTSVNGFLTPGGNICAQYRQAAIAALNAEITRLEAAAPSASAEIAFGADTVDFSSSSENQGAIQDIIIIEDNQDLHAGSAAQPMPTASNPVAQELVVSKEPVAQLQEQAVPLSDSDIVQRAGSVDLLEQLNNQSNLVDLPEVEEEADRLEAARLAKEKEEADRLEAARLAKEKEEADRLEAERKAREEAARKAKEEADRLAKEEDEAREARQDKDEFQAKLDQFNAIHQVVAPVVPAAEKPEFIAFVGVEVPAGLQAPTAQEVAQWNALRQEELRLQEEARFIEEVCQEEADRQEQADRLEGEGEGEEDAGFEFEDNQATDHTANLAVQEQELVVSKEPVAQLQEQVVPLSDSPGENVGQLEQPNNQSNLLDLPEEEEDDIEEICFGFNKVSLQEEKADRLEAERKAQKKARKVATADRRQEEVNQWGNFLNQEDFSDSEEDTDFKNSDGEGDSEGSDVDGVADFEGSDVGGEAELSGSDLSDSDVEEQAVVRRSRRIAKFQQQLKGLKIPENSQNGFFTTVYENGKALLVNATPLAPTAVTASLSLWRVVAVAADGMNPIEIGVAAAIAGTLTFTTHMAGKLLQKRKRNDSAHDGSNKKPCTEKAQAQNQQENKFSYFGINNLFKKQLKSGGDTIVVANNSSVDNTLDNQNKAPAQSHFSRAFHGFMNLFRTKSTGEKKEEPQEKEEDKRQQLDNKKSGDDIEFKDNQEEDGDKE